MIGTCFLTRRFGLWVTASKEYSEGKNRSLSSYRNSSERDIRSTLLGLVSGSAGHVPLIFDRLGPRPPPQHRLELVVKAFESSSGTSVDVVSAALNVFLYNRTK